MKGSEKINIIIEDLGIKPSELAKNIGLKKPQNIYDIQKDKIDISKDVASKIVEKYPQYNKVWLLTGEGERLKTESEDIKFYDPENIPSGKRLIPLYDDVSTIGGKQNRYAKMESESQVSEWIDPGDWFKSATAALRHYEDSMVEYPSGCILALREIQDKMLIVPGKDYVVETKEYRITKKVRFAEEKGVIRLYSTNTERHEDGELIHQPFNLHIDNEITRMFEVLGYVVKKGGGTIVYSNHNNK